MTASDLRELADDELATELADHKEELFNLRFQIVTGQLDDPRRIKAVKTQIARCLTVMREREIAAERAGVTTTPASSAPAPAPSATTSEE